MPHEFAGVIVLAGLWVCWMKGRSILRTRKRKQLWDRVQEVIQS